MSIFIDEKSIETIKQRRQGRVMFYGSTSYEYEKTFEHFEQADVWLQISTISNYLEQSDSRDGFASENALIEFVVVFVPFSREFIFASWHVPSTF